MRTIKRTNQFKRDYKRATKGRSEAYAQKLDTELGAVVQVLRADGTLDPRYGDHPLVVIGRITGIATSGPTYCCSTASRTKTLLPWSGLDHIASYLGVSRCAWASIQMLSVPVNARCRFICSTDMPRAPPASR